jgi:hypothetical protein
MDVPAAMAEIQATFRRTVEMEAMCLIESVQEAVRVEMSGRSKEAYLDQEWAKVVTVINQEKVGVRAPLL